MNSEASIAYPSAVTRPESRRRTRPPRPAPAAVDALAGLAGLGLGVAVALGLSSESWSALGAPGGWLTAAGRLAGLVGTYLMLIVVLLAGRVPVVERTLGQDRLTALAPAVRAVVAGVDRRSWRAHHRWLRPERAVGAASPVRPAAQLVSGGAGGDGGLRAADGGGLHLGADRSRADALRDMVGSSPLHVPGARAVVLPPAGHGRIVRRPSRWLGSSGLRCG